MKHKLTMPEKQVLALTWLLLKTAGKTHSHAARLVGYPAATLYRWYRRYLWRGIYSPEGEPTKALAEAVKILRQQL